MIERGRYEQFGVERTNDLSTPTSEPKLKRIIRSTGSVLLGLIATVVLSLATDVVMHSTGIYPPWGQPMGDSQFALATVYRSVYAILGSYIAAQFAPFQPMQHALALAIVGMILAIAGTIATWNGGPAYARKWYPITLILISVPCGWLGGKLHARRSQK